MVIRSLVILVALCAAQIPATAAQDTAVVSLRTGKVNWVFGTRSGLTCLKVQYHKGKTTQTIIDHPEGRPLFDLSIDATLPANAKMNDKGGYDWQPGPGRIDPTSVRVVKTRSFKAEGRNAVEFDLKASTNVGEIEGKVVATANGNGEVVFAPTISSKSRDRYLMMTLRGPILEQIDVGKDSWYFLPRGRGILSDKACRLATSYGQYAWMQCMGAYGKDTHIVLSMVPLEHEAQPKVFDVQKAVGNTARIVDDSCGLPPSDLLNTKGITLSIWWNNWVPEIGTPARYGPVAVRIRAGDWRDIYGHYREYLKTWWKPKTREWVRRAYAHGGFHPVCADSIQGYVDFIKPLNDAAEFHLAKPLCFGRYLDYSLLGMHNPDGIAQVCAGLRNKGVRATIYVHGMALDSSDDAYKQHGRDWTVNAPQAGEAGGGPPGTGGDGLPINGLMWMNMNVPSWRKFLGDVSTDILQRIKPDGIRLDCIGFTMAGGGNGANPRIHTPPTRSGSMVRAAVDTVAYVRAAMDKVNKNATLGTENLGTDLMMNVTDYSVCYNIWEAYFSPDKDMYPSPVSYVRFVFPDFKFFEIFMGIGKDGEPPLDLKILEDATKNGRFSKNDIWNESLHQALFNGVGFAGWHRAPEYLPLQQTMERVLKENTHCFEGDSLVPEIPTLKSGIYANWFADSAKPSSPRVATLMNWTRSPVAGPVLRLPVSKGERVFEMVSLKEIKVTSNTVSLPVDPMRTVVLRVVPGRILASRDGTSVVAKLPAGITKDQKVTAYVVRPDGSINPAAVRMVNNRTSVVSNVQAGDRIAVQLMRCLMHDVTRDVYVIDDMAVVENRNVGRQGG